MKAEKEFIHSLIFLEDPMKYDGSQLSHLFAARNFEVYGSSIVAFQGSMEVEAPEMVDLKDIQEEKVKTIIKSKQAIKDIIIADLKSTNSDWESEIFDMRMKMYDVDNFVEKQLNDENDGHIDDDLPF